MKIGVIGGGVVGKAVARTYLEFCDEVRIYDVIPEDRTVDSLADCVPGCDITFICVPEGKVDEVFENVHSHGYEEKNYVLKSTVPIGTTRRLREKYGLTNLVHSPEFLTARCAEVDARIPAVNIIGYPGRKGCVKDGCFCATALRNLYEKRFPGIQILQMESDESEAVKLMLNSIFAVKVSLFNELHAYCKAAKLDWETVRAGILADGRITAHHTKVPGPDGKYGFGGKCLPKDLKQMIDCVHAAGLRPWVLAGAYARNNTEDRNKYTN